jgi:hypothetical protein
VAIDELHAEDLRGREGSLRSYSQAWGLKSFFDLLRGILDLFISMLEAQLRSLKGRV